MVDQDDIVIRLQERNSLLEREVESLRAQIENSSKSRGAKLFRAFHTASYLMAISHSSTGKYIDVNPRFLDTLGYSADEVIGNTPDDLHIFADLNESTKYLKLISRLKKIKDYPLALRLKNGLVKQYLFSAETLLIDDELCLLSLFDELPSGNQRTIRDSPGRVLDEIFETVTSYLALFSVNEEEQIVISDLNKKVEDTELVNREELIGQVVDETPLAKRTKLVELLRYVRITEDAHKLASSSKGDDSEGYYMGFPLSSGNIIVTWEPSRKQRSREPINKQGAAFRNFAEWLPEMIFEADKHGRIHYINSQLASFFGYSESDLLHGLYISDLFPSSYKDLIESFSHLRSPWHSTGNEYNLRKKNGQDVPAHVHAFVTFMDDRSPGYRVLVKEISKQKDYENQLRREKAFLENLIDSAPEAITIVDNSGYITNLNREFTNLFGYTNAEGINKNIHKLIMPDDKAHEIIKDSSSEPIKTIRLHKDGRRINVSLITSTIIINGEIAGSVGIYRDITAEIKKQHLQDILYSISNAALKRYSMEELYPIIVSEIGKLWDTNSFSLTLYDREKNTLSIPFSPENERPEPISASGTLRGWAINNGKTVILRESDINELERRGLIKAPRIKGKSSVYVPLRVENEIIGVMCIRDLVNEDAFKDEDLTALEFIGNQIAISLRMRIMLDNLILARQKAEEAAQTKQIFMSTMSHEIRTPLNEVIGITNLLLQGNPSEEQLDYLKTLKFSGNHLLTLVNDVLDYNKIESGKIILELTHFNLTDFLDEIIRSYSFRSKAKNLEFNVKIDPNIPTEVIGDPVRLNQILSNLLSNALKFTNTGSIGVTVKEVKKAAGKSTLSFSISDTGIGIPKDKHSVIFDSFTQAAENTTRQYGGTGLGLAICKKLIELQNGTISLESEPGVGSTFTFTISITIPREQGKIVPDNLPENFSGLEGRHILVAEDNRINFFVANKFLTGWGIRVTHAENGQVALDLLKKEKFDLILMDLHMPVLDGLEAIRQIRASNDPLISNIPIVALTAAVIAESRDNTEELKINDYVLKPFKPHDLFERIYKHISGKG